MSTTNLPAGLFEKIMARCEIDEDSGCMDWLGGISNRAGAGLGVPRLTVRCLDGTKKQRSVPNLLWELKKGPLEDGRIVWRKCKNFACVNTAHLQCGTRAQRQTFFSRGGAWKGNPARIAKSISQTTAQTLSREAVQAIEAMIDAGVLHSDIRTVTGHSLKLISKIRCGKHRHSRGRAAMAPFSSVFALGVGGMR